MAGTLDSILNFIIPLSVWVFLIWIIYRIPVVTQGIDKLREWNSNRRNKIDNGGYTSTTSLNSIYYE